MPLCAVWMAAAAQPRAASASSKCGKIITAISIDDEREGEREREDEGEGDGVSITAGRCKLYVRLSMSVRISTFNGI